MAITNYRFNHVGRYANSFYAVDGVDISLAIRVAILRYLVRGG